MFKSPNWIVTGSGGGGGGTGGVTIEEVNGIVDNKVKANNTILRQELAGVSSTVTQNATDIATLQSNATALSAKVTSLDDTVKTYDTKINDATAKATKASQDVAALTTTVAAYDGKISAAEKKATDAAAAVADMATSVTANTSEITKLKTLVAGQDTKITEALTTVNNMSNTVTTLSTDMTTVKSDVGTLTTEVASLRTDLTTNNTAVNTLTTDMTKVKSDVGTITTDVSKIKTDVASVKSDVTTLTTDNTKLKTDMAALTTKVDGYDTRITTATTNASTALTKATEAQTSVATLVTTTTELSTKLTALETTVGGYDKKISDAVATVTQLETLVNGYNTRITKTETDITKLTTDLTAATGELATIKSNIQTNTNDVTKLKTDLAATSAKVEQNITNLATMQTSLTALDGKVTATDTTVNTLRDEVTALTTTTATLETNVTTISTNLSNTDAALAALKTVVDGIGSGSGVELTKLKTAVVTHVTDFNDPHYQTEDLYNMRFVSNTLDPSLTFSRTGVEWARTGTDGLFVEVPENTAAIDYSPTTSQYGLQLYGTRTRQNPQTTNGKTTGHAETGVLCTRFGPDPDSNMPNRHTFAYKLNTVQGSPMVFNLNPIVCDKTKSYTASVWLRWYNKDVADGWLNDASVDAVRTTIKFGLSREKQGVVADNSFTTVELQHSNAWQRIVVTVPPCVADASEMNMYFTFDPKDDKIHNTTKGARIITVSHVQLEEGTVATPPILGPEDAMYTVQASTVSFKPESVIDPTYWGRFTVYSETLSGLGTRPYEFKGTEATNYQQFYVTPRSSATETSVTMENINPNKKDVATVTRQDSEYCKCAAVFNFDDAYIKACCNGVVTDTATLLANVPRTDTPITFSLAPSSNQGTTLYTMKIYNNALHDYKLIEITK